MTGSLEGVAVYSGDTVRRAESTHTRRAAAGAERRAEDSKVTRDGEGKVGSGEVYCRVCLQ